MKRLINLLKLIIINIGPILVSQQILANTSEDLESNFSLNNRPIYQIIKDQHTSHIYSIDEKWLEKMRYYRTFYNEGESLKYYCSNNPKVYYKDRWEKEKVLHSYVATLQMIIFDHAIKAIGQYAKELELNESEYENLYNNAINFSCSENISIRSHRRLRQMFKDSYVEEYELPSIKGNPLFTKKIQLKQSREEKLINQLYYTVGLFQSACSWGQRYEHLRLLEELVKNEVISAYVIRQMSAFKIDKASSSSIQLLAPDTNTTRVFCDGLICRKESHRDFDRKFPRGVGSLRLADDLKAIYCQNYLEYKSETEPQLDDDYKTLFEKYKGDEINRIKGQFISLITKIPDFNVWTNNKEILGEYLRMGMDHFWDTWAKKNLERLVKDINYEEPLVLEAVDKKIFLNPYVFSPRVVFDLNSGEFDRTVAMNGKLKFKFDVKFLRKDLEWLFHAYREVDLYNKEAVKVLDNRLKFSVEKDYEKYRSLFSAYIIKGEFLDYIWKEIKNQLLFFNKFDTRNKEQKYFNIPVEINISPFAIVYLKNKHIMQRGVAIEKTKDTQSKLQKRIDVMAEKSKK